MEEKANKYLVIILGVLVVAVIILQIYMSKYDLSQLETTLFTILQFTFSLLFAWIISKISLEDQFQKSQKKFALAAYRRIKEIERNNDRLLELTNYKMADPSKDKSELEIIYMHAINVKGTIRSSVADWADIIGKELKVVDKIEEKEYEYESMLSKSFIHNSNSSIVKELKEVKGEIEQLKTELPLSLKFEDNTERIEGKLMRKYLELLERMVDDEGLLELEGFWEVGFDVDIYDYEAGDKMIVRFSDIGERIGTLTVFDTQDRKVGILTNILPTTYYFFVSVLVEFLERSQFEITISNIDRGNFSDDERHYFSSKVKVM